MPRPAAKRLRNLELVCLKLIRRIRRLERQRAKEREHLGDYIGFRMNVADDDEWEDPSLLGRPNEMPR